MNYSKFSSNYTKLEAQSKENTLLPRIDSPQKLKYHNDYSRYEQTAKNSIQKQAAESFSNNSSSVSKQSSSISSMSSMSVNKPSSSSIESSSVNSTTNSPQIVKPPTPTNMQTAQNEAYKSMTKSEIQKQIKQMRRQFMQMNKKLSQKLDLYSLAKGQFIPKQLSVPSKVEFYQVQIETNKKVEKALLKELNKLNSTQVLIKDKDVLLDLQQILIEMRSQLHASKKQQHDSELKNHQQDILLQQIIKVNEDNKDNNAVKLLKLQIIYYMKKQNSLRIQQQHLEHEQKLIRDNDKKLDEKILDMKKTNKFFYLLQDDYLKRREKYFELLEKKNFIKKNIDAFKKSKNITEEKYAREIFNLNHQNKNVLETKMAKYEEDNYELEDKINRLIQTYRLNEKALKDISYKFSPELTYKKTNARRALSKNILKPNLRPHADSEKEGFMSARANQVKSSSSNEKLLTNRYNDKNISMTIDVNLQSNTSIMKSSQALNTLKPRNFRVMSKKEKNIDVKTSRNIKSHSNTIDSIDYHSYNNQTIDVEKVKLLKPKLLRGVFVKESKK